MKQCIIVGCALIAAWTVPAVASAQAEHVKDSRKAEFNLESAIVVGHQTVKAGAYRFPCRMIDGQHFLVVTTADEGAEVARVPCTPEAIAAKVKISEYRTMTKADGSSELTSVRFEGETIGHRVIVGG